MKHLRAVHTLRAVDADPGRRAELVAEAEDAVARLRAAGFEVVLLGPRGFLVRWGVLSATLRDSHRLLDFAARASRATAAS